MRPEDSKTVRSMLMVVFYCKIWKIELFSYLYILLPKVKAYTLFQSLVHIDMNLYLYIE